MENPKLQQSLCILYVVMMNSGKQPKDFEHINNLASKIADWINCNWGAADYEEKKDNFIFKLSEEIKTM